MFKSVLGEKEWKNGILGYWVNGWLGMWKNGELGEEKME
jgi:hypothetical protein